MSGKSIDHVTSSINANDGTTAGKETSQMGTPLNPAAFMNHPLMQQVMFSMYAAAEKRRLAQEERHAEASGSVTPPCPNASPSSANCGRGQALPGVSLAGSPSPASNTAGQPSVCVDPVSPPTTGTRRVLMHPRAMLSPPGSGTSRFVHSPPTGTTAVRDARHEHQAPSNGVAPVNVVSAPVGTPPPPVQASLGNPNERRNHMRRLRNEYLRNARNNAATGEKTVVLTDEDGEPTQMRGVLNRAIRDLAGRLLDVTVKEFSSHPKEQFQLIEHDIHSQFTFNPPLRNGYIKDYLQDALSWCRYTWKSH